MTEINIIDAKNLKSLLDKGDAILIDVREPMEYKEARIAGAINIPLSQLLVKINEIPLLKEKKVILHCKAGVRSMSGCLALEKDGFDGKLWNLEGGIQAWADAGFVVEK
jgi:rhodanese-related sulfurtransferase